MSQWQCDVCTFLQDYANVKCAMCQAPRKVIAVSDSNVSSDVMTNEKTITKKVIVNPYIRNNGNNDSRMNINDATNISHSNSTTANVSAGIAPKKVIQNPYLKKNLNSNGNNSAPQWKSNQVQTSHSVAARNKATLFPNTSTSSTTPLIMVNHHNQTIQNPTKMNDTSSSNTDNCKNSKKSIASFFQPQPPPSYSPGPVPIDPTTKHNYIYPVNPNHERRLYQVDITRTALFHNTLVSLPTGLGKTLIAAVVLYNYRRWFPLGKVVFCAPTRPLVTQQIQACFEIMGMPLSETAEISGKTPPKDRKELWKQRNVFFCTPQTFVNDLSSEILSCGKSIVCVILDEAHKATGKYDYVSLIPLLEQTGARFRIVGLSATPGRNTKKIQEVITNLRISKIEVRLETDSDVKQYMHGREMEVILIDPNDVVSEIERRMWMPIINNFLHSLRQRNALNSVTPNSAYVTAFCIQRAIQEFRAKQPDNKSLTGHFMAAQQLAGITQDFQFYGIGAVHKRISRIMQKNSGVLQSIVKGKEFQDMFTAIQEAYSPTNPKKNNPKLEKLEEVLLEHFERKKAVGGSTRAIVFIGLRDVVEEIVSSLKSNKSLLKPSKFVGQARSNSSSNGNNDSSKSSGMTQREQQQAIHNFKEGIINVLVCTCIGEEGLDIGEVDLIVMFDTVQSPLRMIQRIGRTGRKRDGRVICLVAKGVEEEKHRKSKLSANTIGHVLKQSSFRFYNSNFSSTHTIFPPNQPLPDKKEQQIDLKEKYRLSQVGGYTAGRSASTCNPNYNNNDWKLTLSQEEFRKREFGVATSFFSALSMYEFTAEGESFFPLLLRRKYLRARQQRTNDETHSTDMGATRRILKSIYKKSNPSPCNGRSSRRYSKVWRQSQLPSKTFIHLDDNYSRPLQSSSDIDAEDESVHFCDVNSPPSKVELIDTVFPCYSQARSNCSSPTLNKNFGQSIQRIEGHLQHTLQHQNKNFGDDERILVGTQCMQTTQSRSNLEACSTGEPPLELQSNTRLVDQHNEQNILNSNSDRGDVNAERDNIQNSPNSSTDCVVKFRLPTQSSESDCFSEDTRFTNISPLEAISHALLPELLVSENAGLGQQLGKDNMCSSDVVCHSLEETFKEIDDSMTKSAERSISFLLPTNSLSSSSEDCSDFDSGDTDIKITERTAVEKEVSIGEMEKNSTPVVGDNESAIAIAEAQLNSSLVHERASSCVDLQGSRDITVSEINKEAEIDLNSSMEETPIISIRWKGRRKFAILDETSPFTFLTADVMKSSSKGLHTPSQHLSVQEEDDVVCLLCHCADSTEEDPIVLCDGPLGDYSCNVSVHKSCYLIEVNIDSIESWRCEPCEALQQELLEQKGGLSSIRPPPPLCSLCRVPGGAMKRTPAPEIAWVHPLCVYWTPHYATLCRSFRGKSRLGGGELVTVSSLQKSEADTDRSECSFCRRVEFAVRCAGPNCVESAHPYCALEAPIDKRWFLINQRVVEKLKSNMSYMLSMFCSGHKSFAAKIVEREGRSATEIFGGFSAWKRRQVRFACPPFEATQALGLVDSDEDENKALLNRRKRRLQNFKVNKSREGGKLSKEKRIQKKSRRIDPLVRCFFDEEASLDTDEGASCDDDDEERLVKEMEEQISQDSFINDSTQLGYTQDELDLAESALTPKERADILLHRQLDNEVEKSKIFATPILNRVMRRSPSGSVGSLGGLGNMCFIRSVLEHHRQGGGMTQIEDEFHRHHKSDAENSDEDTFVDEELSARWEESIISVRNGKRSQVTNSSSLKLGEANSDTSIAKPKGFKSKTNINFPVNANPGAVVGVTKLSSGGNAHSEKQSCTNVNSSSNLRDKEIEALIERKRQEATERYRQAISKPTRNLLEGTSVGVTKLPSIKQGNVHLEKQTCTIVNSSSNLTEGEIEALIERKRLEAMERYQRAISNSTRNPYLKK